VQKVIAMVRDLQTKVIMEGKKEAETYDKFACFCKDKSAEKIRDINEAKANVEELSATLSEKNSHRDQLDQTIADLQKDISNTVAEIADEQKRRADAKAVYDTNELDLSKAVQALEEAIATLQASRSGLDKPALLSVKKTVKKAAYMAEALGFASNARALLQQIPEVPVADYDFHSGGIVGTLEQLLGSFRSKHQEIEDAETSEVAAHTSLVQTLKNRQSNLEADLQTNQEEREQTSQEIGSTSKDLTMTTTNLRDDQSYLQDMTEKCDDKAHYWDQRSTMRSDELAALSQALEILQTTVDEKETDRTIRFVQKGVTSGDGETGDDAEDENPDYPDSETAFVQLRKVKAFLQARTPREQALDVLERAAGKLHAPSLSAIAQKVAAGGHFDKIKILIQELIERLNAEAADEANHKGWCDTQTTKATQQRTLKSEAVAKLNTALEQNEAKRDQLDADLVKTRAELAEVEAALAQATEIRDAEKAENADTVDEAQQGKDAINSAIEVLDHFYKAAAKAKSMLQQNPGTNLKAKADDMPETFKNENYAAAQGDATGVIGMMEVILGDFDRTITETEKAEKEAAAAFLEFSRTSKASIAEKNSMIDNLDTELTNTKATIAEDNADLTSQQDLLDKAVQELLELHTACVAGGDSYEDRVAKREEEVASLREALCILDKAGPVQTESQC